ncbi:MAG: tetratricopeptide repeat protein, partial [Bryobacteraceae bacterium]
TRCGKDYNLDSAGSTMHKLYFRSGIFGLAAIFAFATLALDAQRGGAAGGAGGAGSVPGGAAGGVAGPSRTTPTMPNNNPNTIPNLPGTNNPQQNTQPIARPIFLSGKVMLSDGTPPPEPVVIEMLCNGTPRPEGYTDSKGRFSFQLGQNTDVMADASYSPGFGPGSMGPGSMGQGSTMPGGQSTIRPRDIMGCELRASLAGFRSDSVNLAMRRSLDDPDVGTILLHRMANVEGLTISATSALAPKDARKAFEKGRAEERKNKLDDAEKNFEKAVAEYPKFAAAWNELGRIHEQRNEAGEARKDYAQAMASDSKFVNPYEGMYRLAARESKWQDVADTSDRVIRLNPYDFPSAYFYNAVANLNLKKLDDAEKSAREAVKLDTRHANPRSEHVLGVILAQKQDFHGAAEHMEAFLKLVPAGQESDQVKKQLAEVQKVAQTQPPAPAAP